MKFSCVTAYSVTLNVSIRPPGCALLKGRKPEQPMHVYLAAPPTAGEWISFSQLVWLMEGGWVGGYSISQNNNAFSAKQTVKKRNV